MNEPAQPKPPSSGPADDPAAEAEYLAILRRRTSPFGALVAGTRLAVQTAAIGLPVALVYALIGGGVGHAVVQLAISARNSDPAMVELWIQITLALCGFVSLYAMLQFYKRTTVTRASWWPALFAVPLMLVAGALMLGQNPQMKQLGPLTLQFFMMAWSLVWMSFGGAAASIVWLRVGHAALQGRSVGMPELVDEVRTRTLEVAGPHGARIHAQTIGMQLLIPGIFYWLQLAFSDMVAVLDPERPALRRSSQLTFGMRGRLFRMVFLMWWPLGTLLWFVVAIPTERAFTTELMAQKVQELFFDPSAASLATYIAQELVWSLFVWVLQLALLVLYLEREGQVKAKNALKKLKPPANAMPIAPSGVQPGKAQG